MAVEFYRYGFKTAKDSNELDLYRNSMAENIRCVNYIEDNKTGFYANAYKDYCVDSDGEYTKRLIGEFGMERVLNMYAATIRRNNHDGRISKEVSEWAKNFNRGYGDVDSDRYSMTSSIHVGVVNILAKHAIHEYESLKLFDSRHCEEGNQDLQGKVVVISPKHLKEKYWSPENQLWVATGGFGCSPTASGRAVYATCLMDGEECRWDRHKIIGVLKDEFLPDWAREKMEQSEENKIENIDGQTM